MRVAHFFDLEISRSSGGVLCLDVYYTGVFEIFPCINSSPSFNSITEESVDNGDHIDSDNQRYQDFEYALCNGIFAAYVAPDLSASTWLQSSIPN